MQTGSFSRAGPHIYTSMRTHAYYCIYIYMYMYTCLCKQAASVAWPLGGSSYYCIYVFIYVFICLRADTSVYMYAGTFSRADPSERHMVRQYLYFCTTCVLILVYICMQAPSVGLTPPSAIWFVSICTFVLVNIYIYMYIHIYVNIYMYIYIYI
jgi:hypothetical protein